MRRRLSEKALGPKRPSVATDLNNLALLFSAESRYAEAEPFLKRALAFFESVLGPAHPNVAQSLENYAAVLRQTGRSAEAIKMEARAKSSRAKHAEENP